MEKTLEQSPCFIPQCVTAVLAEGRQKLRLYDLGFYQGSIILPLYECMGKGTRVYAVKDTLIALRQKDAAFIQVQEVICHEKD